MKKIIYLLILFLSIQGCKKSKKIEKIAWKSSISKNNLTLNQEELNYWHLKDIIDDTIPGISFLKAKKNDLIKKNEDIIVAILDTEIDINHNFLSNNIWKNIDEIPNNNIDDDSNGYVDDVYGWNFLGNNSGENLIYSSDETVRIIRDYEKDSLNSIVNKELYNKARKILKKKIELAESDIEYVDFLKSTYPKSKNALVEFFPNEDYKVSQLDSLYKIYEKTDSKLADLIYFMSDYLRYNLSFEWINNYESNSTNKLKKIYNSQYFDRQIQGDDEWNLNDIKYGNNLINANINEFYHGTEVAGLVISSSNNNSKSQVKGICENCKILPVCISANGDEHDKDIALGIRYAVDNGARIINMSFGKDISMHQDWVFDAFKYAFAHDVLIVSSAGNSSYNLDLINDYFPNDNIENGKAISENFILVGSSGNIIGENLLSYFSNYGKNDVDIFAPGEMILTTMPNDKTKLDNGTSLSSAIVSGIAGTILSQHPNLTVDELKNIILESGVEFNLPVKMEEENEMPFNQLSKSGKIVNLFNALIMANEIDKK